MELKDFVSMTLTQLVEGVQDAQAKLGDSGAKVNPNLHVGMGREVGGGAIVSDGRGHAHIVQFDLGLTVTEGTGTKGGVGVVAGVFNLGSAGESSNAKSAVSRVQFAIPIGLPEK